jgi:hypothetical protein
MQEKSLKMHLVILTQISRIYNRNFEAKPENADYLVLSTCILHNFIKKYDDSMYIMCTAA